MKKTNNLNKIVEKYREKEKTTKNIAYSFLLLGFDLVVGVIIGLIIGKAIDYYFNTSPAFMLAFMLIGFLSSFRRILTK